MPETTQITNDQLHAIRQFMRATAEEAKRLHYQRWAYFAPGGWAFEQLAPLFPKEGWGE